MIGYRGFKALAFVGGSADRLFAIDTDLARPYWTTHLTYAVGHRRPAAEFVGVPRRPPRHAEPSHGARAVGLRRRRRRGRQREKRGRRTWQGRGHSERAPAGGCDRAPRAPRDVAPPPAPTSSVLAPIPFGGVDPLYVMGSDGLLRTLRVSDGAMTAPMVPFLPPSARPSSLTFINGVIYTSTSHGCGAAPNGVWALDLTADNKVTTWRTGGAHVAGECRADLRHRRHALRRDDEGHLARRRAATPTASSRSTARRFSRRTGSRPTAADFNASPVVFKHSDRELVAASGNDGRLYLLDAASLGGADHRTPLHVTAKYSAPGTGGGLATWEDEGTRWIVASVDGGPMAGLTFAVQRTGAGRKPRGVQAGRCRRPDRRLRRRGARRAWSSPLAPLVVNGMVFAVSSGEYRSGPATLTRRAATAAVGARQAVRARRGEREAALEQRPVDHVGGARARMAAGSGQVYLVTADNHLYAFGIPMEH